MLSHKLRRAVSKDSSGNFILFSRTASSSSANITIPGTAQVGDLAVLIDSVVNVSAFPSSVTPSGWTNLKNDTTQEGFAYLRVMTSYRVLTSGQPGSTITGMSGIGADKELFIFRYDRPILTVQASTWKAHVGSSSFTQTIESGSVATPVVAMYAGYGDISDNPIGNITPTMNQEPNYPIAVFGDGDTRTDFSLTLGNGGMRIIQSGWIRILTTS